MSLKVLFQKDVAGEIVKNIGLGVFINGLYGISDRSIEIFNLVDMLVGIIGIIIVIMLESG